MNSNEKMEFTREDYEELIELLWSGLSMTQVALHDPDQERGRTLALEYLSEYDRLCRLSDLGKSLLRSDKSYKTE